MSKRQDKKLSIQEKKRYARRMYALGWEQNDDYEWICASCKRNKMFVNCGMCKRCEACYSPCKPDTEAGQQATKDYIEKRSATIDFDVFGEPL